ncbi:hypothetical protein [Spiroplasma endosymbiont of Notiophilus biguttatus]|uniref:hypothetical protein n=1 Tax=Spiroplasma endosymbiont of Notiophilus biguttatus TaxID=3066285 RepID=UPI00313C9A64
MTDKTKSQTYNFLSENKSIEDIKKQENIFVKEIKNKRHGGKTIKFSNKTKKESLWVVVNDNLSENEIFYDALDHIDINGVETETKSSEEKSADNIYYSVTIYDEKQSKKTGIEKIHEEILSIENKVFFIITFVHTNQSISEEIMYIHHFKNGDIEVIKQLKQYENISKYKNDLSLIEPNANHEKNIKIESISIKEFLKQHQDFKLKPTKKEWKTWGCIIGITLLLIVVAPICTFVVPTLIPATATVLLLETKVIIAISFAVAGLVFKEVLSLFESATQKVKSWFKNKYFKSKDQKEKEKNERASFVKNLTNDKLETIFETQLKILKQELDNRKDKSPDQLINNNTINHNSNSLLENSIIESENNQNFDSSIRNTINQQNPSSPISKNNWNKVKCLLTT